MQEGAHVSQTSTVLSMQDGDRNQFYSNTGEEQNRKAEPAGHLKDAGAGQAM